jgi:hypothetical protein
VSCPICPNGYACPCEGTSRPIKCEPGTIANGKRTQCVPCAPGRYQSNSGYSCSTSFPADCGGERCPICPNGFACPTKGTASPIKCEPGTIANGLRTECVKCAPGRYQSKPGDYCSSSFPVNCGGEVCPICPNGYICPGTGTSQPKICPPGTIANGLRTECVPCDPGRYRSTPGEYCSSSFPVNCGGESCPWCPNGYICPGSGTTNPTPCPSGSWPNSQRTACLPNNG